MLNDPRAENIVHAIIHFAHSLYLQLVAEGIETKAQLEMLRSLGCQEGQEYYYSKPLPLQGLETRYLCSETAIDTKVL